MKVRILPTALPRASVRTWPAGAVHDGLRHHARRRSRRASIDAHRRHAVAMRIVIDLQACQTQASRGRGVGRYSEALARGIAQAHDGDVRAALNARPYESTRAVIASLADVLSATRFSVYTHPDVEMGAVRHESPARSVAECLVRRHWMALQPDVLHVSHVFEGFADPVVVPRALPDVPGVVRTATLYDLIPLRFPEHYLRDPRVRAWYSAMKTTLRDYDHLLAISEATRRDAIELLGIDPSRITTIHGGADARFAPHRPQGEAEAAFRDRKSTRLNSSHSQISYAVFCLKKKK